MSRAFPTAFLLLPLIACAGSSERQAAPSNAPERLRCDALAAEAIQAGVAADSRDLARRAADCYAAIATPAAAP